MRNDASNRMKKLLVVEDEKDINEMIVHHLCTAGYKVEAAFDGEEAIDLLEANGFDLVILDILLPGMDGWELCRTIRSSNEKKSTPIIFLSALSSEKDRVKGFDLGCDDFLVKPFSPREMVSRVKAILRRSENQSRERTAVQIDNLHVDFLKHKVEVNGRSMHLTGSEFQILQLIMSDEGRVFSREELLALMRENNFDLELGNIDVHVHRLRHKIEKDPKKPKYIQTVWGVGYRFVAP